MKILALDSSGLVASVAVMEDDNMLAEYTMNYKKTHSQTLLPMLDELKNMIELDMSTVDALAIAAGPGSFTGLRIGISAVKGLCAPNKVPCIPVSTLDGIAEQFIGHNCIICAVMDARCNQFYNALFEINNGVITRLCDDRALLCDELKTELAHFQDKKIIVCGDGADIFYKNVHDMENVTIAPENLKFQSAIGVGMFAYKNLDTITNVSPDDLLPVYLRLPQAERELKAKNNQTEAKTK